MLNVDNTLNTENVTPQAGFYFSMAFGTPLKLINAKITAGTARSNQRSGARIATKTGTLLPMSDTTTDTLPEKAYDAVFVSGKDKKAHGRVRSADTFDRHDLVLFKVAPNYKTNNRGEVARDDYDEPNAVGSGSATDNSDVDDGTTVDTGVSGSSSSSQTGSGTSPTVGNTGFPSTTSDGSNSATSGTSLFTSDKGDTSSTPADTGNVAGTPSTSTDTDNASTPSSDETRLPTNGQAPDVVPLTSTTPDVNDKGQLKNEIAMLGRELGFYILIGMQRPDAGSLPMAVRNQLNMRINMGVLTSEIEKMVFPDNDKQLRPLSSNLKGWGFIKIGDEQVRSFFAPEVPKDFNLHEYMQAQILKSKEL